MAVQTLQLAGKRYVLLSEKEYPRLSGHKTNISAEDRRDATILRRRLADMQYRKEKPVPYAQVRSKGGSERQDD